MNLMSTLLKYFDENDNTFEVTESFYIIMCSLLNKDLLPLIKQLLGFIVEILLFVFPF